jgi:cobalt/nickel transport system permease protein
MFEDYLGVGYHFPMLGLRSPFVIAMHMPDGFLSQPVSLFTWVISSVLIASSLRKVKFDYQERVVPLMGVSAAFIFAAQMINFKILGGTSGHLLGGTLAGVLLGPWAGSLVMTVVFAVQALVFQDGGVTVLGANILNMGLIGTFCGYYLYKGIRRALGFHQWKATAIAIAIASWISVVLASLACAAQLSWSGTVAWQVAFVAMGFWHIWIGLGEALITVIAIRYIWQVRPDLLYDPPQTKPIPAGVSPTLS